MGESRNEYQTTFAYDEENRPTALTYRQSGTAVGGSGRTIDLLGRTTFATVTVGGQTYTSEYHFAQGGYGTNSRTGMVTSIAQAGKNWSYSYDDNGNIIQGYDRGKWFAYTYDALGQLIQVNDRSDTRAASDGSTWVYGYDQGGNILSKKLYPYANTSGTPIATTTFTYSDPNWRDKLTAVNGVAITYDAIGNPLNDGTWTYTWQNGRQLASMSKPGVNASFVYNKDGLRVQKTVNGVVTNYTLHGKNVVHMTRGNDDLHFFYDAQGKPAVVVYNGTAYAYVKNLQGDIVGILDSVGNWVVEYTYDAWGAPLSKTGSMAATLGTVNPFRYRGYVYDEETGLYYLRSRYYKPDGCRFLNADILLTRNMYGYCENSPVYKADVNGMLTDDVEIYWSDVNPNIPKVPMSEIIEPIMHPQGIYEFSIREPTGFESGHSPHIDGYVVGSNQRCNVYCYDQGEAIRYVGICSNDGMSIVFYCEHGIVSIPVSACTDIEVSNFAYYYYGPEEFGRNDGGYDWRVLNLQRSLQARLRKYKNAPTVNCDGCFGENTENALMFLQRMEGLIVDGWVGDQVKWLLYPEMLDFDLTYAP